MLTLFSASPRPIRNFFVWTPIASYGAIRQKESWTLMASYGAERVNSQNPKAGKDNEDLLS